MKFTERHRAWLDPTALFLLALGVRLIYISLISGHPYFETLVLDAQAYESRAREILQGIWTAGGVFYQDPFYPYFLALIHKVAGPGLGAVRMVHAVLGALGAVLVYDLGCFLGGRRTGVLAGLIYILYGALAYYDG
ncbi:MAG: glycosyltransferase family 39 protein, partial [Proteobacteria bacterium]|nr:glycosyltransferase family 39 protein [Pseudomonadota bacterium]